MNALRFRFVMQDGSEVTGPVQGTGGLLRGIRALSRLKIQQERALEGDALQIYEPKPGHVKVLPRYDGQDDGPEVHVDLRKVKDIIEEEI